MIVTFRYCRGGYMVYTNGNYQFTVEEKEDGYKRLLRMFAEATEFVNE